MLVSQAHSAEAAISSILSDHFENWENPHETIYKIWLVLNARAVRPFAQPKPPPLHKRRGKTWAQ